MPHNNHSSGQCFCGSDGDSLLIKVRALDLFLCFWFLISIPHFIARYLFLQYSRALNQFKYIRAYTLLPHTLKPYFLLEQTTTLHSTHYLYSYQNTTQHCKIPINCNITGSERTQTDSSYSTTTYSTQTTTTQPLLSTPTTTSLGLSHKTLAPSPQNTTKWLHIPRYKPLPLPTWDPLVSTILATSIMT